MIGADISECQRYRYSLWRGWGALRHLCWVMLNPSTADETKDDPTIRKIVAYSKRWGFSGLTVVNLFAWRATDPREIPSDRDLAVGPRNDESIVNVVGAAQLVVCAWGRGGSKHGRDKQVLELIRGLGKEPMALKINADGSPCHPLYLSGSLDPIVLEPTHARR